MLDIDIPTSFDVGCGEGALPAQSGNLATCLSAAWCATSMASRTSASARPSMRSRH